MTQHFDAIVIGLGGMGSATAAHLAKQGKRVLGLEAYTEAHDRGSSHGRTRIIRKAYFEAPAYVPLVQRAYTLWRELEEEAGQSLLTITGGLNIGQPESEFVRGSLTSARQHGLPYEYLSSSEVNSRFPGFQLPENMVAVYEPLAGILQPEECVKAYLRFATRRGAELHFTEPVRRWRAEGNHVQVETNKGSYKADRLIITAGPWAPQLLTDLQVPMTVQRIVNVHFEPQRADVFSPDRCPVYLWQVPEGDYYGFPALPGQGIKFGRHDRGEACTPQTIRREINPEEIEELRMVLNRYMPGSAGAVKWTLTCMYTNTPDRHFVIDRHPEYPQVVYGCGFSGHGFKFASAIGEVLAELATQGQSRYSIDFLSARRFLSAVT